MVGDSKWPKSRSLQALEGSTSPILNVVNSGPKRNTFASGLLLLLLLAGVEGLGFTSRRVSAGEPSPTTSPAQSPSLEALPVRKKNLEHLIHAAPLVPTPTASSSLAPPLNGAPAVAPSPVARLAEAEAKALLREFEKAQKGESLALEHRQKTELRDLKAAQNARFDEWTRRENETRRSFFRDNRGQGPVLRSYMKDLTERRKTLRVIMDDEKSTRTREQEARKNAVKEDQANRFREFKAALQRGERPSRDLWPRP